MWRLRKWIIDRLERNKAHRDLWAIFDDLAAEALYKEYKRKGGDTHD
jgi:hypothetical protein